MKRVEPARWEPLPLTVDVAIVRGLLSGMTAKGMPYAHLVEDAGIDPAALGRQGSRITLAQYARLNESMMEELDDEMVALLSRPAKRGSFPLQARVALAAKTLEEAIRHVAHAARLLYDDFVLRVAHEGELAGVAIEFLDRGTAANVHVHECLLRCYWRLFAWLVGNQLPMQRVDFAFARPPHVQGYGRIFPAPWRFDAERSTMWFDASCLRLPVSRDEAALRSFLSQMLANVMVPPRDTGIAGRVRVHLQATQPEWPDLEKTARALNVSASTLQRRLAGEGTSFKSLRDQLRRDIAISRLNTSKVALATLASELGFADPFAFQRAFKAWTGCPPGAYRRIGR